ncbi:MAG: hypothetical protein H0T51_13390 [Pirellulales bacterium]|nr:hypothetical protein [Pirellulales bacterium]
MARQYAGIMASLGMTLVLMQALRNGKGFESAVVSAMFWMITLGIVGFMVASLARTTVDEAVRQQIEQELAAQTTSQ